MTNCSVFTSKTYIFKIEQAYKQISYYVIGDKDMKKMEGRVVLCLLVAVMFLIPISTVKNEIEKVGYSEVINTVATSPLDGGWLEEHDGVKILHLSGSSYDMGYQHGGTFKR